MNTAAPNLTDAAAIEAELLRLRWQCRRGMLELDLLLNRFLDHEYALLPAALRVDFVRLLGYPDQILLDWCLGQAVPADPTIAALVRRIIAATSPATTPAG